MRTVLARPRRRRSSRPSAPSPPPRPRRALASTGDVKVAIIVGATHGVTPRYRAGRERGLRRGDQVHEQRRQGLQPQRDREQGQGRGQGRVDRRVPGPRQRLAEPVHLRPEVHDQGRVRAQLRLQQRRQDHRLREQVLRRALDPGPGAGPQRGRAAVPPVLRLGQLRAGQRRPQPVDGQEARRQLRGGVPQDRRQGGDRVGPQPRPVLHQRAVLDPPDDRGLLAQRARRERELRLVRVRPEPGHDVPDGPRPAGRLLPLDRRQDVAPDPGRHGRRVRRHRRGPAGDGRARATPRPACGRRRRVRLHRGRAGRLGQQPARHARDERPGPGRGPRVGERLGRRVADLPGRGGRRRGLDARLVAGPARQRGAGDLGGRRRRRDLLAERRRLAGRAAARGRAVRAGRLDPDGSRRGRRRAGHARPATARPRSHRRGRRTPAASTTAATAGTLEATDGWGNGPLVDAGSVHVDTTAPVGRRSTAPADDVQAFTPERRRRPATRSGSRSTPTSRAPRPPPCATPPTRSSHG